MSGVAAPNTTSRFYNLLSKSNCLKPLYDQVLARLHNCVITPTRGSILPNWVLVVPEEPMLNFSEWCARGNKCPSALVNDLLSNREIDPSRAIWFEHGPSHVGSAVGCGVDHAHIHVVIDAPFTIAQMVSGATKAADLRFVRCQSTGAYDRLNAGKSYLLLASHEEAFIVENVEHVGPQFLRRIIASLVGREDDWDYHLHPHLHNVQKTIHAFSAA